MEPLLIFVIHQSSSLLILKSSFKRDNSPFSEEKSAPEPGLGKATGCAAGTLPAAASTKPAADLRKPAADSTKPAAASRKAADEDAAAAAVAAPVVAAAAAVLAALPVAVAAVTGEAVADEQLPAAA